MGQKTEIKFEVEETVTLKQGGKLITEFCPRCGAMTELASPDIISLATGASEREIFRLIESGSIHFDEKDRLVVCTSCYANSIADPTDCN